MTRRLAAALATAIAAPATMALILQARPAPAGHDRGGRGADDAPEHG